MSELMKRLRDQARSFSRNADGATAIEYAIMAGGIGLVVVLATTTIGANLKGTFTAVGAGF